MPMGIKDLKEELSEMNLNLAELTKELKETKNTITESLKEMMSEFSKSLKDTISKIADMSIHMNVRDNILENLGLDKLLPGFLKKK